MHDKEGKKERPLESFHLGEDTNYKAIHEEIAFSFSSNQDQESKKTFDQKKPNFLLLL